MPVAPKPQQDLLDSLTYRHPIAGLAARLDPMWTNGWHPLDVARLLGADQPLLLTIFSDALTLNRRQWHHHAAPVWTIQADSLAAGQPWWDEQQRYWPQFLERHNTAPSALQSAATLFCTATAAPHTMPLLEAPPSQPGWGPGRLPPDSAALSKVRALLAKAESTTFDEEAEALSAKAQELIARHSIDVALLADEVDVPGGRRIYIEPPYAKPKFVLLDNIAAANGCRSCWNDQRATATLIGHQTELHLTEMLFTSLLLQATAVVVAAKPEPDPWGRSTIRSWRNAFWYGYAYRIGQRLEAASNIARAEHQAETGIDLLPVLVSRNEAVEKAFEETFPNLANLSTSISNGAGLTAGHLFGGSADLVAGNSVRNKLTLELLA